MRVNCVRACVCVTIIFGTAAAAAAVAADDDVRRYPLDVIRRRFQTHAGVSALRVHRVFPVTLRCVPRVPATTANCNRNRLRQSRATRW